MKRLISISMIILLLCSCNRDKSGHSKPSLLSHLIDVTENEKRGVDEVLEYYGGKCLYSVGFNFSTSETNAKYFELEVLESEALNNTKIDLKIPLSNIAFQFYRHLRGDSHPYTEIHSIIKTSTNTVNEKFKVNDLEEVYNYENSLNKYLDIIASKQYDTLLNATKSEFIKGRKEVIVNGLIKADSIFGDLNQEEPFLISGFKLKKDIIRYYIMQLRKKENCELRIDIDVNKNKGDLIEFEYQYE